MPESQRAIAGRLGAHKSWGNTVDRTARTRKSRAASPAAIEWHLNRLGEQFDDAPEAARLAAAESARKAYFANLAMKSAAARRRGGDAA
jgi:hypothetical protein